MPHQPSKPTCPTCAYDLTGLIEQGSSATCPECNTDSTYAQATTPRICTPTLKHAIIWVLAIPSGWMTLFWAQLNIGNSLDGAMTPYISGLILMLYLPTFSLALLIMEWRRRRLCGAKRLKPSFLKVVLIVIACFAVSMTWNWVVFTDWVEGVASV